MFVNKTNSHESDQENENTEEINFTEHSESLFSTKMFSITPPEERLSDSAIQQKKESSNENIEEQWSTEATSQQPTIQITRLSADNTFQTTSREYIQYENTTLPSLPTSFSPSSDSDSGSGSGSGSGSSLAALSTANPNTPESTSSFSSSHPSNGKSFNPSSPLFSINHIQPSSRYNVTSSWIYGPPAFLHFMNTRFPSIQQQARRHKKTIVYQKKGTTGMAGQITGVCDSLLLAILHKRPFQSK